MPTYQYRCTECRHDLEAVQKFSDPALTECPSCHGQLRKVYNAVGVVFKGSGFYRTDSRKPEGSSSASTSSNGSNGSNGSSGSGSSTNGSSDSGSSASSGSSSNGTKESSAPAKAAAGSSTGSSSSS